MPMSRVHTRPAFLALIVLAALLALALGACFLGLGGAGR